MPTLCMRPTRSRPRSPRATSSISAAATPSVASTRWACSRRSVAGGGEAHRARAPGSLEHRGAGDALERGDLLADGGLGVAERLGRLPEGAGLRDRHERLQVPHLEVHGPSISDADAPCKS